MRIAALCGVLSGCLILAIGGGEAPAWLRCILCAGFMILALCYGFMAFTPYAPQWLSSMPVIGTLAIIAGSLILWVPPNIVLSSAMIGFGCRCILLEHKKEEQHGSGPTGTRLCRRGSELAHREPSHAPAHREEG